MEEINKKVDDLLIINDISLGFILLKTPTGIKFSYKGKLFNVINLTQKTLQEIIDKIDELTFWIKP